MSDRELLQQALEALEAAEHFYHHVGLVVRRQEIEGVIVVLRERLAQKYHWREQWNNSLREAIDATTPPRREWVGMTEEEWAALWKEFAWESEFNSNEQFQEEMVKKHGKGHYYMDTDEAWNRQKDLIQKLVTDKLREKNT